MPIPSTLARSKHAIIAGMILLLVFWYYLEQNPRQTHRKIVIRWVVNSQERDQEFAKQAKREFEESNPDIHVEFIKQNEGAKTDTMIAGGDAPDIIQIDYGKVYYYRQANALVDLSELMSEHEKAELKSFFSITLSPFTEDHHVYGIPWGYVPFILYYNKGIFDQNGIPYPPPDWKWNDYRQIAKKLTKSDMATGETSQFGASYATWQEGYYCWIFQNGGSVIDKSANRTTFQRSEVIDAVKFLELLSRRDKVVPTDSNHSKSSGGLFESGKLAMNGPTGSFYIPTYRTFNNLDWDIADVPAGPNGKGTIITPIAYGVSSQSRHAHEAYRLVKFLGSQKGQEILAKSGLFVPCRKSVALSPEYLFTETKPKNKYALVSMLDDRNNKVPWAKLPPWQGARWSDVNDDVVNTTLRDFLFGMPKQDETPETICKKMDVMANQILIHEQQQVSGQPIPWRAIKTAFITLCLSGTVWIAFTLIRNSKRSPKGLKNQVTGYLAISPWLLGFLVFSIVPYITSLGASLTNWNSLSSVQNAKYVGLYNYSQLISGSDDLFVTSLFVTFKYAIITVPLTLAGGLGIAMHMNSKVRGIAIYRAIFYLPAIVPSVGGAILFRYLLQPNGLINKLLGLFSIHQIRWLQEPAFAVPSVSFISLWAVGASMMIYLAGLQNIPTQLYEAAKIDGAGVFKLFLRITLPMLTPTLFFNLVMGIIGSFQVFSTSFVLYGNSGGPNNAALFFGYYLYRRAFEQFQAGYASALGWVLFLIVATLTALVFRSSSFWVYYESERDGDKI